MHLSGFHVIHILKFRENRIDGERMGFIELLKRLMRDRLSRIMIVDALDDYLKSSAEEDHKRIKIILNQNINNLIGYGTSIIFVVRCNIEIVDPYNPKLCEKSLASLIPRLPDLNTMQPNYIYYPYM